MIDLSFFLQGELNELKRLEDKLIKTEKELELYDYVPEYKQKEQELKSKALIETLEQSLNSIETKYNQSNNKVKTDYKKTYIPLDKLVEYKNAKNLSKDELGKRYERYIGYVYENLGYKVEFQGLKKGKKDRGIDLIAKKKKDILIIQCKRIRKDGFVRENTIQQLKGVVDTEKRKNPKKIVKGILYTVNDNLDQFASEELNYSDLEHIVLAHPLNENYPLIKCNISGKNKEKIYHLPHQALYDRIKIEINKGEKYVETEKEAIELGFRKAHN